MDLFSIPMKQANAIYQIWVWAVGQEFGYLIVDSRGDRQDIIRKHTAQERLGWMEGISTLLDFELALKKRALTLLLPEERAALKRAPGTGNDDAVKAPRGLYRLYEAVATQAPMCFNNLMSWLWYQDAAIQSGDWPRDRVKRVPNICLDCSAAHQAKMIREDRCSFPHLDIRAECVMAARQSGQVIAKRKRGRPKKTEKVE